MRRRSFLVTGGTIATSGCLGWLGFDTETIDVSVERLDEPRVDYVSDISVSQSLDRDDKPTRRIEYAVDFPEQHISTVREIRIYNSDSDELRTREVSLGAHRQTFRLYWRGTSGNGPLVYGPDIQSGDIIYVALVGDDETYLGRVPIRTTWEVRSE